MVPLNKNQVITLGNHKGRKTSYLSNENSEQLHAADTTRGKTCTPQVTIDSGFNFSDWLRKLSGAS